MYYCIYSVVYNKLFFQRLSVPKKQTISGSAAVCGVCVGILSKASLDQTLQLFISVIQGSFPK